MQRESRADLLGRMMKAFVDGCPFEEELALDDVERRDLVVMAAHNAAYLLGAGFDIGARRQGLPGVVTLSVVPRTGAS